MCGACVSRGSRTISRRRPFAALAAALHAACASATANAPASLPEVQREVETYIDSGRYLEDFAKVVTRAQAWMQQQASSAARPAIVLDIDETSLSNWPAYRANGWGRVVNGPCDLEKGPCGLRAWQASGQAKALAPTLALVQRARELGVAVFFISGRPPTLLEATERNLREQGYEWTGVVVLPEGAKFASAAEFKAPERKRIEERGYTILLTMGDQESDLTGGHAQATFKLPNPVYYLP